MHVTKRAAVAALTAAAFAGSSIPAVSALGDKGEHNGKGNHNGQGEHRGFDDHHGFGKHRGNTLLETTLAPSIPTDHAIHGVAPGGVPWVLRFGEARLRSSGRIDAVIRGLVIPPPSGTGTAGPVTMVSASLYCGNDTDTTPVGTTTPTPLSTAGNARIQGTFTLPAKCLAPVVLIHPNGNNAAYITASGFGG
jgi:hypothetical protein